MISDIDAEQFSDKISAAAERVVDDYVEGDAVHEDPVSSQLTGRLKETLVDFETEGFRWQTFSADSDKGRGKLYARQLTSRRSGEEAHFGADIIFCLDIASTDYSIKKGFLVQAKRLPFKQIMIPSVLSDLQEQCKRMLRVTASSVVFLYSQLGIHVVPASAVLACKNGNLYEIATWPLNILFFDFAICWFGDPLLKATDPASLEELRQITDARNALLFSGRSRP